MNRLYCMFKLLLKRDGFARAQYILDKGLFSQMGKNCYWHPFKIPAEPQLIALGDNVVVATGVQLITHDMSYTLFSHDSTLNGVIGEGKYPYFTDRIRIGSNVMIGANSLIMPGVSIGNHVIIGAGSIVTKDVPDGVIVAGCPARIIGDYYEFAKKRKK